MFVCVNIESIRTEFSTPSTHEGRGCTECSCEGSRRSTDTARSATCSGVKARFTLSPLFLFLCLAFSLALSLSRFLSNSFPSACACLLVTPLLSLFVFNIETYGYWMSSAAVGCLEHFSRDATIHSFREVQHVTFPTRLIKPIIDWDFNWTLLQFYLSIS